MNWKKTAFFAVWSLVAAAWLAQIPAFFLITDKTTLLFAFAGAVLMTEIAVYCTAWLLGMTLIQSRKRIWQLVTSRFRKPVSE